METDTYRPPPPAMEPALIRNGFRTPRFLGRHSLNHTGWAVPPLRTARGCGESGPLPAQMRSCMRTQNLSLQMGDWCVLPIAIWGN